MPVDNLISAIVLPVRCLSTRCKSFSSIQHHSLTHFAIHSPFDTSTSNGRKHVLICNAQHHWRRKIGDTPQWPHWTSFDLPMGRWYPSTHLWLTCCAQFKLLSITHQSYCLYHSRLIVWSTCKTWKILVHTNHDWNRLLYSSGDIFHQACPSKSIQQ